MSTENQESSFELICFWRGKYEYFLWVLLINIFGEACFGNVVKEDYQKVKILINGVIANVVERRRCQWVLTNQDRSEVLRKYVLCVYYVCVCTVCMCICGYVCLCILSLVLSTKNVHVSDFHIFTIPASIQGLKVKNIGMATSTEYWNILKIPRKMLQFSIFHFYSRARKKSGQYWHGHHMIILEEHIDSKKML